VPTDIQTHYHNTCFPPTTTTLQPFYSSLDFVRDYLGKPVPEK